MYSCNDTDKKEDKKETTVTVAGDSTTNTMRVATDTTISDTSHKGGQPTLTGH